MRWFLTPRTLCHFHDTLIVFLLLLKMFFHIVFLLLIHVLVSSTTSWLNPLFRLGYKKKLEEDDMYKVLPEDASDRLGEELQW